METAEITNGSTTNGAAITKRTRKTDSLIEGATSLDALSMYDTAEKALKAEFTQLGERFVQIARRLGLDGQTSILSALGFPEPPNAGANAAVIAQAKWAQSQSAKAPTTAAGRRARKPAKVKAVAAHKAPKPKAEKAPTERLARRSAEDIQAGVDRIVALLQSKPALRSEQITAELSLDKRETPGLLKAALKANAISFTGRKRATQYSAR